MRLNSQTNQIHLLDTRQSDGQTPLMFTKREQRHLERNAPAQNLAFVCVCVCNPPYATLQNAPLPLLLPVIHFSPIC